MPDPQPQPTEPSSPPSTEPSPEDAFWDKLDARLDAFVDRKIKSFRDKNPTSTSRGGAGRTTLPSILADVIFGKAKD